MADAQQHARAHALHLGLLEPHHAIVRSGQRPKHASEPERQRPGDDANGLGTRPARGAALGPQRCACAEEPPPPAVPRKPPPGEVAARRGAEQHDFADAQHAVPLQRLQHHQAAVAVAD